MLVRLPSRSLRQRPALLVVPARLSQAFRWFQPRRVRFQAVRSEPDGSGAGDRGIRRPEIAIPIYRVGMDVIKAVPPDDEFWSGLLTDVAVWRA